MGRIGQSAGDTGTLIPLRIVDAALLLLATNSKSQGVTPPSEAAQVEVNDLVVLPCEARTWRTHAEQNGGGDADGA